MCDCIPKMKALLMEQLNKRIESQVTTSIVESSKRYDIVGEVFRMDGSTNTIPAMTLSASYRVLKTDGTVAKNSKKETLSLFGSHCPFCGEPHVKPEEGTNA